jgi:hypothetical protein
LFNMSPGFPQGHHDPRATEPVVIRDGNRWESGSFASKDRGGHSDEHFSPGRMALRMPGLHTAPFLLSCQTSRWQSGKKPRRDLLRRAHEVFPIRGNVNIEHEVTRDKFGRVYSCPRLVRRIGARHPRAATMDVCARGALGGSRNPPPSLWYKIMDRG